MIRQRSAPFALLQSAPTHRLELLADPCDPAPTTVSTRARCRSLARNLIRPRAPRSTSDCSSLPPPIRSSAAPSCSPLRPLDYPDLSVSTANTVGRHFVNDLLGLSDLASLRSASFDSIVQAQMQLSAEALGIAASLPDLSFAEPLNSRVRRLFNIRSLLTCASNDSCGSARSGTISWRLLTVSRRGAIATSGSLSVRQSGAISLGGFRTHGRAKCGRFRRLVSRFWL